VIDVGALIFGLVVGYITYRTLIRTVDKASVSDLATVLSAIGGGAVVKLYDPSGTPFAFYSIGLTVGMTVFFFAFWKMTDKSTLAKVMAGKTTTLGGSVTGTGPADSNHGSTVAQDVNGPQA
jgi:hypothetical protein